MNNKRKLLDTFKNIDPSLSQLDSLKELLFIHSIPYKESEEFFQPTTFMGPNTYYSGPSSTHNTICVNFSSVGLCIECKFTNKRLAFFNTTDSSRTSRRKCDADEKDLMNAVYEWFNNQFNKTTTP
jgi:hypothetical protein